MPKIILAEVQHEIAQPQDSQPQTTHERLITAYVAKIMPPMAFNPEIVKRAMMTGEASVNGDSSTETSDQVFQDAFLVGNTSEHSVICAKLLEPEIPSPLCSPADLIFQNRVLQLLGLIGVDIRADSLEVVFDWDNKPIYTDLV